jgi:hypothetical protein
MIPPRSAGRVFCWQRTATAIKSAIAALSPLARLEKRRARRGDLLDVAVVRSATVERGEIRKLQALEKEIIAR